MIIQIIVSKVFIDYPEGDFDNSANNFKFNNWLIRKIHILTFQKRINVNEAPETKIISARNSFFALFINMLTINKWKRIPKIHQTEFDIV